MVSLSCIVCYLLFLCELRRCNDFVICCAEFLMIQSRRQVPEVEVSVLGDIFCKAVLEMFILVLVSLKLS